MSEGQVVAVQLRYVVARRGRLFWQPTPEMQAAGFLPKPLGLDGPASRAEGTRLYQAWLQLKANPPRITSYPAGSLGGYWDRYRRISMAWRKKQPRSREDYFRAWARIDAWRPDDDDPKARELPDGARRPTLARTVLTQISTDMCEAFYAHLDDTLSPSERYRTVKCLKSLLQDAVVRLKLGYESPAANLNNPQAPGRSQFWFGHEIPQLVAGAEALGYAGLAIGIRIAWDTLFSPGDVWPLRREQLHRDRRGWYFERSRAKTGKAAYGALSDDTAAALFAYVEALPFELAPESPIIRQRNGHGYRAKDTFAKDFRAVRGHVFPGDTRQLLDIRRSGNLEADAGGADKATMGELLANNIASSSFLDGTYTPPTVAKSRDVALQRVRGRKKLIAGVEKLAGHTRSKKAP